MKSLLAENIKKICLDLYSVEVEVTLDRPLEEFGDFATNVAMHLVKPLKKNPQEIAKSISAKLEELDFVKTVDVAGPGFINITLTDTALMKSAQLKLEPALKNKKVVVEYSDPNPFKPLHAGHLYTTLVGDAIARLVENAGAKTIRINYGGDVGLHVAKSMWAIIRNLGGENPDKLAKIAEVDMPVWLGERYVEGNNAYEDDEPAKDDIIKINKKVYDLHTKGDKESKFAQIYWTCRESSYNFFTQLYKDLQVRAFDRFIPESEVTPLGLKTVRLQQEAEVFELSDGAVVFDGEKYGLHTRVFINSAGLPTYETKDVGLSLVKWQDYNFDESIIITASEQAQYMQVVLKAIEQFEPEPALKTRHLTHGVVKLQSGVKMSSRKGNIVSAFDILEAARLAGEKSGASENDVIMLSAVKYAFLKNRIGGDIAYDPVESIAMEGNSGPYLQYAHARARSILQKSTIKEYSQNIDGDLDKAERSLLRKLTEYPEVVSSATLELAPHLICSYLYELAQNFNRFYEQSKVVGDAREAIRLYLVNKYAGTLKDGLALLGIQAPDSM